MEIAASNVKHWHLVKTMSASQDGPQSCGSRRLLIYMRRIEDRHYVREDTLTVTVRGSTAVAALPLVGQLLLAVLLAVATARRAARHGPGVQ